MRSHAQYCGWECQVTGALSCRIPGLLSRMTGILPRGPGAIPLVPNKGAAHHGSPKKWNSWSEWIFLKWGALCLAWWKVRFKAQTCTQAARSRHGSSNTGIWLDGLNSLSEPINHGSYLRIMAYSGAGQQVTRAAADGSACVWRGAGQMVV